MLCFLQNVRLLSISQNLVMLKRKYMVLQPVYAARKRTITGSYQNQYGAHVVTAR